MSRDSDARAARRRMPVADPVRDEMARLSRGRRRRRFATVLARTLFWGLATAALLAWITTLEVTLIAAGAALVLAVLAASLSATMAAIDQVEVAKRYDDCVGTKDLLSSSLELAGKDRFVAAVREDARAATGRAEASELYPMRAPRELRWLPLPVAAAALAFLIPMLAAPAPHQIGDAERAALERGADRLDRLAQRSNPSATGRVDDRLLDGVKNLADQLRDASADKRKALAELARLASQLDRKRKEMESEKLRVEKNAAKLARGEDMKDVRRDMDAGRYREAANRVKKKIRKLEQKLAEARKRKAGKLEIQKLRKKLAKLRTLLAELEELRGLGKDLGFLVEVLEALERIEGELGELGEFDGDEFDQARLGRARRPRGAQDMPPRGTLLVMPSNRAGKGHAKKVLGPARRSLTEREEKEARLREGKGKSSFGQVRTANDGSRSRQAYGEAFLAARRAAEDAIYRQRIPAGYRSYIRRYFERMQPDERKPSSAGK